MSTAGVCLSWGMLVEEDDGVSETFPNSRCRTGFGEKQVSLSHILAKALDVDKKQNQAYFLKHSSCRKKQALKEGEKVGCSTPPQECPSGWQLTLGGVDVTHGHHSGCTDRFRSGVHSAEAQAQPPILSVHIQDTAYPRQPLPNLWGQPHREDLLQNRVPGP